MSADRSLSHIERLNLIKTINSLPDPQFEELVFALNPPQGVIPANAAAKGDRTTRLLTWAENTGPGLAELRKVLWQITGKTTDQIQQLDFTQELLGLRNKLRHVSEDTTEILRIFQETISAVTFKTRQILHADRVTVFFLNERDNELWSLVAETNDKSILEIVIPVGKGFSGKAAETGEIINIGYDAHNEPGSEETRRQDKINNYRTYTLLSIPIIDSNKKLIAVIQFINKLKQSILQTPARIRLEHIDKTGFTDDEAIAFQEHFKSSSICNALQEFHDYYSLASKVENGQKRLEFVQSISKYQPQEIDDLLEYIMEATRKPVNADRCTLWLLDREKKRLHAPIRINNELDKIELYLDRHTAAIAVQVANSGEPKIIDFDFYDDKYSSVAKKLDRKLKYRTCNLLCMPVFDAQHQVIGVTQLVNKTRKGDFPEYNPQDYPKPPAKWIASFSCADARRMEELNKQIGEVLETFNITELEEKDQQLLQHISSIAYKACGRMHAERTTIYLLNEEERNLFSIIAEDGKGGCLGEIQLAIGEGLAGKAAQSKKFEKVDKDFYLRPRSLLTSKIELKTGYRIENAVAIPLFASKTGDLIAVIEFFNKIDYTGKIDNNGFCEHEIETFLNLDAKNIVDLILEFSKAHQIEQTKRIIKARLQAEHLITKQGLSKKEQLRRVMQSACEMVSADRVTLWIKFKNFLTGFTIIDQGFKKLGKIPISMQSIAGATAITKDRINIKCDLYKNLSLSRTARIADSKNCYRTCSLLCVPISDFENKELVGVLQLVNKTRNSKFLNYKHEDYPDPGEVPDYFNASFTTLDEQKIIEFSRTVGTLLHYLLVENELKMHNKKFSKGLS